MVDNLQDMPSAAVKLARAANHISPPARSAVARFFDTPELVLMLLEQLHQDRIDLLVVAAVCKQLRALALQAWMWHFDFGYKSFEGKLKLVQANVHLLGHIRCLHIVSCETWHGRDDRQRRPLYWSQVQTLFCLLAAHTSPYAQGPLLDIRIDTDDGESLLTALQPLSRFTQRIAALRLIDIGSSSLNHNGPRSDEDHNTASTRGWNALALLLDDVIYLEPTAVALRVLEYQCSWYPKESEDPERTAKKAFWCGVTTVAHRSLQELHLLIDGTDPATYVLQYGAFASLKRFELLAIGDVENDRIDSALIDTFLHRHTGLQQLSLEYHGLEAGRWDPILDQAFPALLTLEFGQGVWPSDEATLYFLRRHPGIRQFSMFYTTSPHLRRLGSLLLANVKIYKHIPGIGNSSPDRLSDLMKTGARPLQARVDLTESPTSGTSSSSDDNRFSDLGYEDWNGIRPEHVQDLTYLQVGCHDVGFPSLVSKSRQLFGDDLLPALTELCIRCNNDPLLFSDLFSQLTSATSLRILHIYAEASILLHAEEKRIPAALFFKHVFPIRFELLCWRQSKEIGTTYFRFLPDDLENERSIHPAAARMGKIGRLQAVPERTALIQVSKDGAWHDKRGNPWKNTRNMFNTPLIFLDHKGAASPVTR